MSRRLLVIAVLIASCYVRTEGFRLPSKYGDVAPTAFVNIGGKTYFFSPLPERLEDAFSYCNGLDLKLLSLDTKEKSDLFTDYFASAGIANEHWTSGFKMVTSWVWTGKGERFSYVNWAVGEPNYTGTSPAGVVISSSGKWLDYPEYGSFMYICEEQEAVCN